MVKSLYHRKGKADTKYERFHGRKTPLPEFPMNSDIFFLIIQFVVLLLSLSVHESAHAWTADRLGDPTAKFLGRVSLNPIVHIDPIGTILLPLIGLYSGVMFGWAKPTPVSVNRLRHPARDYMLVSA